VPATKQADAATKQLGRDVNANNLVIAQGAEAARALTNEWVSAAHSEIDKKIANVQAGASALARQYGLTTDKAIALADAAGVDMSKGILKSGQVASTTAAELDRYRRAVEMAGDPALVVADGWARAENEGLKLEHRIQGLTDAMNAYFNPAMGVLSATNAIRDAFSQTNKAMKDGKTTAAERSRLLEADLSAMGRWISAQEAAKRAVQLTDGEITKHLPKLVELARGNKVGKEAIAGLASSLGGTITQIKGAIIVTDRLGHAVKILPSGKTVKISADTARAQIRLANLRALIAGIHSKSVTIAVKSAVSGAALGLTGIGGGYRGGPIGKLPRKTDGGLVDGPGTETSDSVLLWGSKNEYMVNAKSTKKHLSLLQAINADKYAGGGLVGYAGGGQVRVGGVSVSEAQWRSLGQQLGKEFVKTMSDGTASQIASLDSRLEKAIGKLFAGKKTTLDNRLIASLDKNSAKLEGLAKQRDAATKAVEEAKQFAGTLAGNAKSFAGIGGLEGPGNAKQVRQGLQLRLSSLTRFASVIKQLGARGLSKSILRQILEMGPEDGLKYGEMLLVADKSTFSQINAVQKQIDATSSAFGRTGADILFDAGKHAGDGFLTGLQASLKGLDKEMDKLAKKMAASLKKALKIKSPSRLPAIRESGFQVTAGVGAGMAEGLPHLDRASALLAARLSRPRVRPAIAPLIAHSATARAAAGAGATIVNVTVLLDGRQMRASFQSETLRYGARNARTGLERAS
jgi:hypothetical protein